jgi:hypothetical protein
LGSGLDLAAQIFEFRALACSMSPSIRPLCYWR